MKHEIKFRAWHSTAKRMYYPSTLYFDDKGKSYPVVLTQHKDEENYYTHGYSDEPVMQYTGLKDKNDKEIYEGDIVKMANDVVASVQDIRTFWKIYFHKHEGDTAVEIIGNIYENSDLLTKKE